MEQITVVIGDRLVKVRKWRPVWKKQVDARLSYRAWRQT